MSETPPSDIVETAGSVGDLVDASTVVEALPMPAFVLDPSHTLVGYNYGYAELTGIGETEALGEDYRDLISETVYADGRRDLSLADKVIEAPESADEEYDVKRIDRGDEHMHTAVYQDTSTILSSRDEERDIVFVATPIHEDGDLAAVLELAEEVDPGMEEFPGLAGVLSHDLRNPLNVIQTYVELSRDDIDDDHYRKIRSSIDRMDRLMDDVMTLAESSGTDLAMESVDLDRIARGSWRYIEAPNARLETENLTLRADPSRLQQILENLFRNAVEHGQGDESEGDDGGLTVRVGPLSDGVLYVEDNGVGIPEDERDAIFERGYSTSDSGTGFGLAIVERLVSDHGWEIRVTDSSSGGARFEIVDPDAEDRAGPETGRDQ